MLTWLGIVCAVTVFDPSRCAAYVPTRTSQSGIPIRWQHSNRIYLTPNTLGSDDLPTNAHLVALQAAVDAWHRAIESTSYVRFSIDPASPSARVEFLLDGQNLNTLTFVESGWQHSPTARAITTIFWVDNPDSPDDGRILDADTEINGQDFRFSTTGEADKVDLQSVLTQELGHVLGLGDLCDDLGLDPPPTDGDGNPVPACNPASNLPAWMLEATMYGKPELGETKKRSPEADDIAGAAALYPLANDPGVAARVSAAAASPSESADANTNNLGSTSQSSGCAIGASCNPTSALAWLVVALVALPRRRYRKTKAARETRTCVRALSSPRPSSRWRC